MKILVLNGPNLNLLGRREPHIYGSMTLADVQKKLDQLATELKVELVFFQSNHEGELVDWIQEAGRSGSAIILNGAAYTHTSIAIHDALRAVKVPIIEVHLSNPHARERFRHRSYVSLDATGVICGLKEQGYLLAVDAVAALLKDNKK